LDSKGIAHATKCSICIFIFLIYISKVAMNKDLGRIAMQSKLQNAVHQSFRAVFFPNQFIYSTNHLGFKCWVCGVDFLENKKICQAAAYLSQFINYCALWC